LNLSQDENKYRKQREEAQVFQFRDNIGIRHNNQTTVFLICQFEEGYALLHDNRIFHFKTKDEEKNSILKIDDAILYLNDLLTTLKYRSILGLYLHLRLMDYAVLLYFAYVLFTSGFEIQKLGLYLLIALEISYDVMDSLTKFWTVERVKLFIALGFYVLYFAQFFYLFPFYEYVWNWGLLLGRFVAWALEVALDIALDAEIHDDIIQVPAAKEWFSVPPTPELDKLNLHYLGSCSSLLFTPVVNSPTNRNPKNYRCIFLVVVIILAWFLVLPLCLLAMIGAVICYLLGVCFGACQHPKKYFRELFSPVLSKFS